jgi:glutathione synthase/RimK-type ligase-like ATP-grasp enzyme
VSRRAAAPAVALATCAALPAGDEDAPLLTAALSERGVAAASAVWDDDAVDWRRFDLVVPRSTWDYAERRDAFLAWASRLPRVENPVDVLRWNSDKRYLGELAASGVPLVPTSVLAPGDPFAAPAAPFVVKPAVSAGARGAAAYAPGDEHRAAAHVSALHAEGRSALVQPFFEAIHREGETGLVYLGGSYSHAFGKAGILEPGRPPTGGLYAPETIDARTASPDERAVAEAALAAAPFAASELLYARVDVVPGPGGEPVVLELELTEPSLYLAYEPGAAARFADAITARLRA